MRLFPSLLLLAAACAGDTGSTDTDTDAADTDTDTDADSDTDTDADSDTDTDADTDTTSGEGILEGEGEATITSSSWIGTESVHILADSGYGAIACTVTYDLVSTGVRSDCAQCDFAFDLEVQNAAVTFDDGRCLSALGVDASTVSSWNGQTRAYGYVAEYFGHAEAIVEDYEGSGWGGKGYSSFDGTTGDLTYQFDGGVYPF